MPETEITSVDAHLPDKKAIETAARILKNGGLVAFPTETVYGIGANYNDAKAIKKLYEIKKRPLNKPFTVHISNLDMITEMGCEITPQAEKLVKKFWPGPLTIILPIVKGGKIGFRMPKNVIAIELIEKSGVPVVAPSANLSGNKPPSRAEEILKDFDGKIDLILDGGETQIGTESTVVDLTEEPFRILRKGAISSGDIYQTVNGE